ELGLLGRHQIGNAGAACAALEALGDKRNTSVAMAAGLRQVVWPARFQRLHDGPLTRGYAGSLIVDGAHNPAGAPGLAEAVASHGGEGRQALILAMQDAKDARGFLDAFRGLVDEVIACDLPNSGGQEGGPGIEPHVLVQMARDLGLTAEMAGDYRDAL